MKLYYHRTDGGAEYYGLNYIVCANGHREGVSPFLIRTDGNEIEVFVDRLKELGIKLVLN